MLGTKKPKPFQDWVKNRHDSNPIKRKFVVVAESCLKYYYS